MLRPGPRNITLHPPGPGAVALKALRVSSTRFGHWRRRVTRSISTMAPTLASTP